MPRKRRDGQLRPPVITRKKVPKASDHTIIETEVEPGSELGLKARSVLRLERTPGTMCAVPPRANAPGCPATSASRS
eukprot:7178988-Pyramimonas_sp.AAC.1